MPPAPERLALTDLGIAGCDAVLDLPGARRFHAESVRRWVFQRGARAAADMTDLPRALRSALEERYDVRRTRVALERRARDGTIKLLLELRDGHTVETVMIPEGARRTLCVSTQVGCGVRCAFCASGMLGLVRNLSPGEIVEQFLTVRELLQAQGEALSNMVLMGGGEPLNNFENVKTALDALNSPRGAGFGARRITVSTIGIPAKIDRLEELGQQINLAVSLHAPNEELRGRLIPGADRVPLQDVLAAAARFFARSGREVTYEYVLLRGVNDTPECAHQLARLLHGARCRVNLIPLNDVHGLPFRRPTPQAVLRMAALLTAKGIRTTVRRSRGRDIDAACGQLRRRHPSGAAFPRPDRAAT